MSIQNLIKGEPDWHLKINSNFAELDNITEIGNLTILKTTDKTNLVNAINENTTNITSNTSLLSEKANNWLKGKKINFISDSMGIVGTKTLPTLLGENLDCTVTSYAISGNMLSRGLGIAERSLNMDITSDVNIAMGGTNDWSNAIPLGSMNDTTRDTIYGALKILCQNLINTYPNAINAFITPLKRSKVADVTSVNYLMEDVVKAIYDVCGMYNVLVIDTYNNAPNFNPNITTLKDRYAPDGLHPNDVYLPILANTISNSLLTNRSDITIGDIKTNTILIPLNNFTALSGYEQSIDRVGSVAYFNAVVNVGSLTGSDMVTIFTLPYGVKLSILNCLGNNGEKYSVQVLNNSVSWFGNMNNTHIANLTYVIISGTSIIK